jgi:hypothetical protein
MHIYYTEDVNTNTKILVITDPAPISKKLFTCTKYGIGNKIHIYIRIPKTVLHLAKKLHICKRSEIVIVVKNHLDPLLMHLNQVSYPVLRLR